MTRTIPTSDSADAVDRDHLLAVFDPDRDDPIAQKISDVTTPPAGSITPAMLDADTDDEKAAMRARIAAGTSDFTGAYSDLTGRPALGAAAARDVGGANGVAGLNAQGTLFANLFPSYIATDAEVTAAIEALKGGAPTGMDTLKELADAIGLRLHDRGGWSDTAYAAHDVVRRVAGGGTAFYMARTAIAAGNSAVTAPGTGSAWKESWYRIGWTDGAPSSHTGAPTYENGVLTITDRGGNAHAVTLAGGADSIVTDREIHDQTAFAWDGSENVSIAGLWPRLPDVFFIRVTGRGRDQDPHDTNSTIVEKVDLGSSEATGVRIQVGGAAARTVVVYRDGSTDNVVVHREQGSVTLTHVEFFALQAPQGAKGDTGAPGSLVEVGSANYAVTGNRYAAGAGSGIDASAIEDGDVLAVRLGDTGIGPRLIWLLGADINDNETAGDAATAGTHFATAAVSGTTVLLYAGRDANGKLLFTASSGSIDPTPLTLYRMGSTTAPALQPHVSSFAITSGNASPVAGSIENDVYGVAWAIAQSSHAGPVRIVAFKGTAANPTSVSVLKTLADAEKAHGSASVTMPAITLAAGETPTHRSSFR